MCIKMSDVRLSNASPTLERVDARQPDSVRPAVRRCLFGPPDREELRDYVNGFLQGEERRFRETYNFDPVEDRPLSPGRYQWEIDENAPEFYRRAPHRRLSGDTSRQQPRAQVETAQGPPTTEPERPRKRPSDPSGSSCNSESSSKSSRYSDDEPPEPGSSQAVAVAAQAPVDQ